jgi:hypothetical protein
MTAPYGGRKADIARGCRRGINLHRQKGDAIATYASCGNVNLPPSSMVGVDKVAAVEATDKMIDWRSGSVLYFRSIVIGVATNWKRT